MPIVVDTEIYRDWEDYFGLIECSTPEVCLALDEIVAYSKESHTNEEALFESRSNLDDVLDKLRDVKGELRDTEEEVEELKDLIKEICGLVRGKISDPQTREDLIDLTENYFKWEVEDV